MTPELEVTELVGWYPGEVTGVGSVDIPVYEDVPPVAPLVKSVGEGVSVTIPVALYWATWSGVPPWVCR